MQAAAITQAAASADVEHYKALVGAAGVVLAALLAAVVGTIGAALITTDLQRKRNEQDRESQWRSHAIELTKLDAERLMKAVKPGQKVQPFILTFLANYRDLQELGERTPAQLYLKIQADRISQPDPPASNPSPPAPPTKAPKKSNRPTGPRTVSRSQRPGGRTRSSNA